MSDINQPTFNIGSGGTGNIIVGRDLNLNQTGKQENSSADMGSGKDSVKKILILATNPKSTARLRLDEEVREIEEGLQRAKNRDRFEIHSKWAVRLRGVRRALLDFEPHIVHFTGHGEEDGLIVEDELGFPVTMPAEALTGLFKLCAKHVKFVMLSACYTGEQAAAISKHIDYVIGMKKEIKDKAAVEFAVGFYDALGAGRKVEEAFEFGRNAILTVYPNLPDHLTPVLKIRKGMRNGSKTGPKKIKPLGRKVKKALEAGLRSLENEEYKSAFDSFRAAREMAPDDEEVVFYYCLSFLSGKALLSIAKAEMNEINLLLNKIVQGKNPQAAKLARIVLGIIHYDYYIKNDYRCRGLSSKELFRHLGKNIPGPVDKQLVSHIIYSEAAKIMFHLN